jgi:hypothetical protein
VVRSQPGPLEELPRLLVTADVHLISLRPEFSGIVLPSKVYGCLRRENPSYLSAPLALMSICFAAMGAFPLTSTSRWVILPDLLRRWIVLHSLSNLAHSQMALLYRVAAVRTRRQSVSDD